MLSLLAATNHMTIRSVQTEDGANRFLKTNFKQLFLKSNFTDSVT